PGRRGAPRPGRDRRGAGASAVPGRPRPPLPGQPAHADQALRRGDRDDPAGLPPAGPAGAGGEADRGRRRDGESGPRRRVHRRPDAAPAARPGPRGGGRPGGRGAGPPLTAPVRPLGRSHPSRPTGLRRYRAGRDGGPVPPPPGPPGAGGVRSRPASPQRPARTRCPGPDPGKVCGGAAAALRTARIDRDAGRGRAAPMGPDALGGGLPPASGPVRAGPGPSFPPGPPVKRALHRSGPGRRGPGGDGGPGTARAPAVCANPVDVPGLRPSLGPGSEDGAPDAADHTGCPVGRTTTVFTSTPGGRPSAHSTVSATCSAVRPAPAGGPPTGSQNPVSTLPGATSVTPTPSGAVIRRRLRAEEELAGSVPELCPTPTGKAYRAGGSGHRLPADGRRWRRPVSGAARRERRRRWPATGTGPSGTTGSAGSSSGWTDRRAGATRSPGRRAPPSGPAWS